MENIYKLTGRYAELNDQYEALCAQLEEAYEENGGEVTAETEAAEKVAAELQQLKQDVISDIIANADEYAAIEKNKEAQKKIIEAELKALKEEQAKVVARYEAKIARLDRSIDFWKENFNAAMQIEGLQKIGGAKTDHKFSIYYSHTTSVEVTDEAELLRPYERILEVCRENLPAWLPVKVSVSKSELKKLEAIPTGAEKVERQTIQIR